MDDGRCTILSFNSGSSSHKFALYRFAVGREELIAEGAAEGIGIERGRLWIRDGGSRTLADSARRFARFEDAFDALFDEIARLGLPHPDASGHRVVHGGPDHFAPERVTPALIEELRRLVPFAPLHLPVEIRGLEAMAARYAGRPQAVCFDTGFHRGMPEIARRLALPRALWDEGIRRYGFHGLSYEYIMEALGPAPPARVIIAHLGNGASMAAVRDGNPVDTTMGFTPSGGFMMSTRSGDLDPGALLYLLAHKGYDAARLERTINHESGLLGVSGLSPDVKELLEARASDPRAALALEMFCYQMRKQVGAFAAALGGLDLLVFTAGIGERAAPVRAGICQGLRHLGVILDAGRNNANAETIGAETSRCAVRVIPTNEDLMIARHTRRTLFESR